ncbi:S9 family peptidase [Piscinibacter sp.]|uniref:S9 family peptidase n=1 Tax=Piscinibacter sp. TaxID=1903157 RepID=UPI0039E60854
MTSTAPIPARRPKDVSIHGETRIDDWHWLRERDDPEVIAHLKAENAHTEAWFAPHAALKQRLYDEMLARIQEDDDELPWRKNGWWHWSRTAKGRQYETWLRRRDVAGAAEEVMLDLNALAEGKPFLQLGALELSPDNTLLAYSLDETGALDHTLRVRELATGADLPVAIEKTEDAAWGNDSRTLYYLSKDEARRTHRVWRHRLGAGTPDELLYEESDELFWLGLGKTRDERFIVISSASKDTTELRVVAADDPAAAPRIVLPRRRGIEMSLDHRHGRFYLLVNDSGRNFRLVETDADAPSLQTARELIAQRDDVMLEDVDLFERWMVVQERELGTLKLRVFELADDRIGRDWHIPFDETVYSAGGQVNEEFDSEVYRVAYTSMVTPYSIIDVDLRSGRRTLKKRQPVLGGYDPARYDSTQILAHAADGTEVPVSLVWRRDLRDLRRGQAQPLLMYGYGAYGIAVDPYFSSSRLSLLDRGVVFAIAHVRGGGDRGRRWYDDGKLAAKPNSFSDFVACAEALVAQGWTTPAQLIVEGGSAGGLLVAAANLRPDLFRAVVAEVPFVDVINTMLDETLPLTVGEFLEWGNPKLPADYAVMRRYSPYDNLRAAAYPAMYLRAGLNDSQVPCWEAAKYAAKLRSLKTDDEPVLLSVNLDAGHGGASGRYDALAERAEVVTFMLAIWGLAGPATGAAAP